MAKRFTDTEKYNKRFYRNLPGPYKLLWDYLYHKCNHAGIWHVDFEIAQIYIGTDMKVDHDRALELFNEEEDRIKILDNGHKWFIASFVPFQYDCEPENLNPANKAHLGIIKILNKHGLISKPLSSPSLGVLDKDKEKELDKEKEIAFNEFWKIYPPRNGRKILKPDAWELFRRHNVDEIRLIMKAVKNYADSGQLPKDPPRFLKPERGQKEPYWRSWVEKATLVQPPKQDFREIRREIKELEDSLNWITDEKRRAGIEARIRQLESKLN